jgi:polysaccharide export outer membrane protein
MKIAILKYNILFFILIVCSISSCVPYKELRYFNDVKDIDNKSTINIRQQKTISPFDNIYVKVLSTDEKTSKIFNTADDFKGNTGTISMMGYIVDENGNINFPFVGDIKVAGFTTFQASEIIHKALTEYISNTSIIVKYIDSKVTVMGEVQRQGVFTFSDDKINIYQAISLAGGLTRFGSHKNIILIRQEGQNIVHHKLNLSDSKISESELFYVLPNDVVVVEPLKSVSWSYQNMTYSTILASITTLITIVLAITSLQK